MNLIKLQNIIDTIFMNYENGEIMKLFDPFRTLLILSDITDLTLNLGVTLEVGFEMGARGDKITSSLKLVRIMLET